MQGYMNTTIQISKETKNILQEFKKKSETYDEIIRRMYNNMILMETFHKFTDENEWVFLDEFKEWLDLKIKKDNRNSK